MNPVLTFDIEDWFHSLEYNITGWDRYERRIEISMYYILKFLEDNKCKATFFILGDVAKNHKGLVKEIAVAGHEIGSHSYNHEFIYLQSPQQFKDDLKRSIGLLSELTGKEIISYRAPYFSITRKSLWAFDILANEGIKIDSSIFPVMNHRYGIPGNCRFPYSLPSGLWEWPITTFRKFSINIPFSGGVYFRFLPLYVTKYLFYSLQHNNEPVIFYFHPWEFDPLQPKIKNSPFLLKFRHYYGLINNFKKFSGVMKGINSISLADGIHILLKEGK